MQSGGRVPRHSRVQVDRHNLEVVDGWNPREDIDKWASSLAMKCALWLWTSTVYLSSVSQSAGTEWSLNCDYVNWMWQVLAGVIKLWPLRVRHVHYPEEVPVRVSRSSYVFELNGAQVELWPAVNFEHQTRSEAEYSQRILKIYEKRSVSCV